MLKKARSLRLHLLEDRGSRVPPLISPLSRVEIMAARALMVALLLVLAAGEVSAAAVCPRSSAVGSILGIPAVCSALDFRALDYGSIDVVEGDEATLLRALKQLRNNRESFLAVLFYASWCPFSKNVKPNFQRLSSLFPTIHHFAFEESVIRPSILSRYGVHGFPTLFILNSTMWVRYHGSRTINSLVSYYNDVTGENPMSLDSMPAEKILDSINDAELKEETEQENCPFSWARSPEKLLQQDTYLALAISFVLLRLLYILFPKLNACVKWAWGRHMQLANLVSLDDYFQGYVEQAKQGLKRLNPCKGSNLHEGAMNARAWASKSLVSVSIGEPSSGRIHPTGERG